MERTCSYCKQTVEFVEDETGLHYCPICGFYEEEVEEATEE